MYLFLTWWAWYIGALCEYMYLRTWGGWAIEHSRSLADAEMYVCWEGNTGCVRIAFLCHFTIFTYRDGSKVDTVCTAKGMKRFQLVTFTVALARILALAEHGGGTQQLGSAVISEAR